MLHPDKNKTKHQTECTKLIQTSNKVYYRTIQLLSQNEPYFDQILHEGKVHLYSNLPTLQKFTIYRHKDRVRI